MRNGFTDILKFNEEGGASSLRSSLPQPPPRHPGSIKEHPEPTAAHDMTVDVLPVDDEPLISFTNKLFLRNTEKEIFCGKCGTGVCNNRKVWHFTV